MTARDRRIGYDALGRRTSTSDTTEFGTQSSTQYWSGMTPSGVSTAGQDAVALVRDVTGELAVQASAGEVSWTLLDRLASTVASTDGSGQLSQLAGYADHGTPEFETTGWDARLNFTGEPDDPTAGTTALFARSYDTTTGTFTTRDLWRGVQTAPQTLNRYAYVLNDPATYIDVHAFRIGDPSSYNTTSEAKAKAMRAADKAINLEIANKRLAATGQPPLPAKCKPGDPCAKSNPSDRHPAGGGVGPWQLGWEWLTGTGPKHRNFGPSDEFTQLLRSHQHYRAWVDKLSRQDLHVGDEFVNNYALSGVEGVGKYIVDYSTLLTGGATGNLPVTCLGSHTASATVIAKNPDGSSVVRFVAENSSSLQSALRPPVIGYEQWYLESVGEWLNEFSRATGIGGTTSQTITWTETIR